MSGFDAWRGNPSSMYMQWWDVRSVQDDDPIIEYNLFLSPGSTTDTAANTRQRDTGPGRHLSPTPSICRIQIFLTSCYMYR